MKYILALFLALTLTACGQKSQDSKDRAQASAQQSQYAKSQPVPNYNWSLERHNVIELYNARNAKAATHSVWRSNTGMIEGDCPSIGFGIPYDTSLTNPLKKVGDHRGNTSIEQAEPNGIFASKNTAATWVLCAGEYGNIEPVYVESKVTTYPYPVKIDYDKNRVAKAGKATITITQ
jgi:hypothetical protein